MISERTKAGLAVAKLRGTKFRLAVRSKAWRRRVSALGRAALIKAAVERAEAYRVHIEWAFRQPGVYGSGRPISFRGNERNIESPMGGRWAGHQLLRMALRLGIHHPTGHLRREVVQARVAALWKEHPEVTAKEVIASLGLEHPLGSTRAWKLLRECRLATAKRSSVQKEIGWHLDRRTAARIRISAIWKKHPEFTAKQVIEKLGPGPFMTVRWVQKIMKECWRASARHSPKQWRKGRRFYHSWRGRPREATNG